MRQHLPVVVDPVDLAGRHDVVIHRAHLGEACAYSIGAAALMDHRDDARGKARAVLHLGEGDPHHGPDSAPGRGWPAVRSGSDRARECTTRASNRPWWWRGPDRCPCLVAEAVMRAARRATAAPPCSNPDSETPRPHPCSRAWRRPASASTSRCAARRMRLGTRP